MTDLLKPDKKIKVALLGATGVVGQVFVHLLTSHRYFEIAAVCGSHKRAGKRYGDEVTWTLPFPLSPEAAQLQLTAPDSRGWKEQGIDIVFSALPSDIAAKVEPRLRDDGFYVFSNASALRTHRHVPILIPEANPGALESIREQGFPGKGFVVTNANCSTTGLAVALAPLRPLGIREIFVSTYQSVSGAGYPGLPALDILSNVIPFIGGEEEKMVKELQEILDIDAAVFPHCVRVPVPFGHLETVWLTLEPEVETKEVRRLWDEFRNPTPPSPLSPVQPVCYLEQENFPQPGLSFWGSPPGMQVFVGRLRKAGPKIGFTLLVNNLVKGAAGGSVQNAELFAGRYL